MKKIKKTFFAILLAVMSVMLVACKSEEPEGSVEAKLNHAEKYMEKMEYGKASELYYEVLDLDKYAIEAYEGLVMALLEEKSVESTTPEEVVEVLRQANGAIAEIASKEKGLTSIQKKEVTSFYETVAEVTEADAEVYMENMLAGTEVLGADSKIGKTLKEKAPFVFEQINIDENTAVIYIWVERLEDFFIYDEEFLEKIKGYLPEYSINVPDSKPDEEIDDSDLSDDETVQNEQEASESDVVSIYADLDDATRKIYLDIAKEFTDAILCGDVEEAVYRVGEVGVKCASLDVTGLYEYAPSGVNYQLMEYEYLISGDYYKEFENLTISMTFWDDNDYTISVRYYKGNGKGQLPVINSYEFKGNVESLAYGVDNKLVYFDHDTMTMHQYWRYANGYAGEAYSGTASDCREDVREMNENMALWTDDLIDFTRKLSMK